MMENKFWKKNNSCQDFWLNTKIQICKQIKIFTNEKVEGNIQLTL